MAKASDIFIDNENFKQGLYALEDTTKAPFGSARTMRNMRVTDSGGISPRLGTALLGTFNSSTEPLVGLYNFRKSYDQDEFLIKAYEDELEVYSKNHTAADWFRLKNGFTSGKEFGFITSLVNTSNEDYVIFCNRYEPYQRWQGAVTQLNGALVGAETSVVVDSVLTEEIFESETATASSTTTVDVAGTPWADDQWIGFYIYITSGAQSGQIRLISDNDSNTLTFASMTDPGNATFEIRKAAFPASGTIIYNGTTIAYTAIPTATTFSVGSAHASADNAGVTLIPTEYPAAPRGNRLTNYLARIIVGNVRSAMARDSGGALSGFASAGSYFVSKLADPFDFSFSATRIAGEGDIIATPYGGGDINDVSHQEDTAYVLKARYIEAVKYSQDSNDLANRTPLKAEIGSIGPVIKGSDDIYFITDDKKFTSIGRVASKDILPQTENIGFKIKRLLDDYVFGTGRGIEDEDRIYIPCKSSSSENSNDIIFVYNKVNKAFDGIWEIHANYFQRFNNLLYYGESSSANVYQMNTGHSDTAGSNTFPISAEYATHFMNLTPSHGYVQAMNSLYFEGYIKGNTSITFKAWKDFASSSFLQFDFAGTETGLLDGSELAGFLGSTPIGLRPMGAIGETLEDGRRHFYFRVYFPFQYGNHFSIGFESDAEGDDYEITRFGLGLAETVSVDTGRIKSI